MTTPLETDFDDGKVASIFRRLRIAQARRRYFLDVLQEGMELMSQIVDEMVIAVGEEVTVSDSVEVLLDELFALFEGTLGDAGKLTTLLADLRANKDKQLEAIVRNTPQAQP